MRIASVSFSFGCICASFVNVLAQKPTPLVLLPLMTWPLIERELKYKRICVFNTYQASSNASSQSHVSPSYSNSPQPYYVTHPLSVIDYEEDYQGELHGDSKEDNLTTAMMLLARAITQKLSTPTNNHLHTSSNTRNQAVIQDGRVDIQTKNVGYGGNGNMNVGIQNRNQAFNAGNMNDKSNQIVQHVPRTESNLENANVQCYNCNEKGHYARDCQKPRVRDWNGYL
ncbi:retrovirus-related pol polyprotein from transposon TNT 1-94, partial [Tanacetum coccineum]